MPKADTKAGHGGARAGSGRKPKEQVRVDVPITDDPVAFLLSVMNDKGAPAELRVKAAEKAANLRRTKGGVSGKKGEQKQAADVAASGRFAPSDPPRLVVNNKR